MQDMRRLLYFDFSKVFFYQSTTEKSPSTCGRISFGTFFPSIYSANPSSHCGQFGCQLCLKIQSVYTGKSERDGTASRMDFFFLNSNPSMAFLSLLFFGVGVLNGSFPRILKVFFSTLPPWFFSGEGLETKDGHDWNEVKTMCKHDEMAGICSLFVSSKGFGRVFEGPWNEQLYLLFLFA